MTDQLNPWSDATKSPFDNIMRTRPDGSEYWDARDLQKLESYSSWDMFMRSVRKAMRTAENLEIPVDAHFHRAMKMVKSGVADVPRETYELSRFACYLVAMNGDSNKPEVAAAQAYFAAQTHFAEKVQQGGIVAPDPVDIPSLAGTMFRSIHTEYARTITAETAHTETAAALARAMENLTVAFAALNNATPTKTPAVVKSGKGKSLATGNDAKSDLPAAIPPFVSQEGKNVTRYERTRHIPVIGAEVVTWSVFASEHGLELCGRCGQALSHTMTGEARRRGLPAGRKGSRNTFTVEFWLEMWIKYETRLAMLHAEHERGHTKERKAA